MLPPFQHRCKACFETSHLLPQEMPMWAKDQNWSLLFSSCTEKITEGIQSFLPERRSLGSWISSSVLDVKETATTFSVECCASNSVGSACEKSFINLSGTINQCFIAGFLSLIKAGMVELVAFLILFIYLNGWQCNGTTGKTQALCAFSVGSVEWIGGTCLFPSSKAGASFTKMGKNVTKIV